ncbi:hypothetical protein Tco_1450332, partial [Tanacetum coccineum]
FVHAFKADLLNLVTTAGGSVVVTKLQLISSSNDADADVNPNDNQVTVVGLSLLLLSLGSLWMVPSNDLATYKLQEQFGVESSSL